MTVKRGTVYVPKDALIRQMCQDGKSIAEMSPKEKVIREAYGDSFWSRKGTYIDKNGWYNPVWGWENLDNSFPTEDIERHSGNERLKILSGIDDNNGWVRIESFDTVQIQGGKFKIGNLTPERWIEFGGVFDSIDVVKYYAKGEISHYKLIPENLKPLY